MLSKTSLTDWADQLLSFNVRGVLLARKKDLKDSNHSLYTQLKNQFNHQTSPVTLPTAHKLNDILGSEKPYSIIDVSTSFCANDFCGIIGTIIGGGILVLLIDNESFSIIEQHFKQKEKPVYLKENNHSKSLQNKLLNRFISNCLSKQTTAIFNNEQLLTQKINLSKAINSYNEQTELISKIKRVSTGHSRRPLVITADRGRGKSSALGIAAAQLIAEKPIEIIVTAPHIKSLNSFFKHAHCTLEQLNQLSVTNKNNLSNITFLKSSHHGQIKFYPFDQLLKQKIDCHTIYIDEAASLPVSVLSELTNRYNRLVFSTTIHGYEGNGQGFEIRFKNQLLSTRPQSRFANLVSPIRWSSNDELEKSLFSAFLLNSNLINLNQTTVSTLQASISQTEFNLINKAQLLHDEKQIKEIFSLLINAHYQTRPKDLERLLQDKSINLYTQTLNQQILGVCLVAIEGDFTPEQCEKIADKAQSFSGHLLPQSILTQYGLTSFGENKFARIMRIAIHPQVQNIGLGSLMLKQLKQNLASSFDFLGTSFSLTKPVANFWIKNNYQPINLSASKNAASGEHSLQMLFPLNDKSGKAIKQVNTRFTDNFLTNLSRISKLQPPLLSLMIQNLSFAKVAKLSPLELNEVQRFIDKKRKFYQVADILKRQLIHLNQTTSIHSILSFELLCYSLFTSHNDTQIIEKFNLKGKKALQLALRTSALKMLEYQSLSSSEIT